MRFFKVAILSFFVIACLGTSADARAGSALARHSTLGAGLADKDGGVTVTLISPGSAAAAAGLQVGDIVRAIGGVAVDTSAAAAKAVRASPSGVPTAFDLVRAGAAIALNVVLNAAADEHDPDVTTSYESIAFDGSLRRTLVTAPNDIRGNRPAVLIIGGIGCFTIDSANDHEDPYLRLAHDLSRSGFVVMRLEKSGVGDSQGPPCASVDFATEYASYLAAVDALRRREHVDPNRVYLFGHSIGTIIAPRLALERQVAGIVTAEGVGRNWFEYELLNLRRQLELGGDAPDVVDDKLAAKERCMHRLLIEKADESDIERVEPDCKNHNVYPVGAQYVQQVAALNIARPWTKIDVPLLAIYGTADFVTAQDDHQRLVDIVNARHHGAATLQLIDGMDHHLSAAGSVEASYNLRVKQQGSAPYEERLGRAVTSWLCARVKDCTRRG